MFRIPAVSKSERNWQPDLSGFWYYWWRAAV